jgi:hypothetical protein
LGAYILWTAVAVTVGALVLLGYFFDVPTIRALRILLLGWAAMLAAAALLLGLLNLAGSHLGKVNSQAAGWPYSAVLLIFLLGTLALGVFFGPDSRVVLSLFQYIQLPVEASLVGLLAITLTVAGFRLLARRRDFFSLVFVGSAVLVLIGTAPWLIGEGSGIQQTASEVRIWLSQVWAAGGARGILLGVALGAIATGVRVLLGADRPYGD